MKNIIFDIGNVLLSFQPENYLEQYYDASTMGDLMTIIFSSDEWVQLDLGTMMIDDAKKSLASKHPHYHDEIIYVLDHWTEMMTPIQENVRLIDQLKQKGHALYLLSNFHKEAIQQMFDKYDFFKSFDGGVISAHEHVIKPDYEIYEILLDRYHLNPQESLFIDDMLANIHAANHLGIHGLHLGFEVNLEEELKNIGVL